MFDKFIAIILVTLVLFIHPILNSSSQHDQHMQVYVAAVTTEFVDNVRQQGRITQEMYNEYVRKLSATSSALDVEMIHAHVTSVPAFNDGTGEVAGTEDYVECKYTEDIMNTIFSREVLSEQETSAGDVLGEYHFRKGDYFTVLLKSRDPSFVTRVLSRFNAIIGEQTIYFRYGGEVRDENF